MSEKLKLINKLVLDAAMEIENLDTSDEEVDDALDDLTNDLSIVLSKRCAVAKRHLRKSTNWYSDILPSLDDKRFKQLMRVTRSQFALILGLIVNHTGFTGKNCGHQLPIETQLAITLYRLGSSGTGASISKVAALFGVSDGGSILIITRRVFKAVLAHEKDFINWPNEAERSEIVRRLFHELPHCFGYIDGSDFPLSESPSLDPISYFSRKQRYAIKAQAVCDDTLKIRHLVVGYPGSVHDARIFANSGLSLDPISYFGESEWLAGDSAYRLTEHVVTPFRKNSTFGKLKDRQKFNRYFSSYRVRIENCFGILKQKFSSLKELRTRIKDKESHQFACEWITVCAILHNIILPTMEDEDLAYTPDADEQTEDLDHVPGNADQKSGELKRQALYSIIMESL